MSNGNGNAAERGTGNGAAPQNGGGQEHKDAEPQSADVRLPNSRRVYVEGADGRARPLPRGQPCSRRACPTGTSRRTSRCASTILRARGATPTCAATCATDCPPCAASGYVARGDVEEYEGREVEPQDDGYLTEGAAEFARVKDRGRLEPFPGLRRAPLRAQAGARVTQMHYARRGIVTPEMEFVALRENMGREAALHAMQRT